MTQAMAAVCVPVSYSISGAVEATGISERTIYDAVRAGDLVAHTLTDKPGSKKVIRREDLDDWVQRLPVWEPPH